MSGSKAWSRTVVRRLRKEYPDVECALVHRNAYELTVATILSAQCTDQRVNLTTPALFSRYPTPQKLARARAGSVEGLIRSTGFFRNKTKNIIGMAKRVVDRYGGTIPESMEELLELPGVARKTANVVLGVAYGRAEGVVVDTHVKRLGKRLGLTARTDPVRIERELMVLLPKRDWIDASHLLIRHGRLVCGARKPRCGDCVLADRCPSRS